MSQLCMTRSPDIGVMRDNAEQSFINVFIKSELLYLHGNSRNIKSKYKY